MRSTWISLQDLPEGEVCAAGQNILLLVCPSSREWSVYLNGELAERGSSVSVQGARLSASRAARDYRRKARAI